MPTLYQTKNGEYLGPRHLTRLQKLAVKWPLRRNSRLNKTRFVYIVLVIVTVVILGVVILAYVTDGIELLRLGWLITLVWLLVIELVLVAIHLIAMHQRLKLSRNPLFRDLGRHEGTPGMRVFFVLRSFHGYSFTEEEHKQLDGWLVSNWWSDKYFVENRGWYSDEVSRRTLELLRDRVASILKLPLSFPGNFEADLHEKFYQMVREAHLDYVNAIEQELETLEDSSVSIASETATVRQRLAEVTSQIPELEPPDFTAVKE